MSDFLERALERSERLYLEVCAERNELQSRLDEAGRVAIGYKESFDQASADLIDAQRRLGSIEKFDEASGLCCVKGCTELSVWCCPPLCEHHTALLEPVVETPLLNSKD